MYRGYSFTVAIAETSLRLGESNRFHVLWNPTLPKRLPESVLLALVAHAEAAAH